MARPFKELPTACRAAADSLDVAAVRSFNQAIKRGQPRFRDAARQAAGSDRVLSRHKNKTKLDAEMKIKTGRQSYLVVNAKGPWGIRDSTDASRNKTAAHDISPKRTRFLKFKVDGEMVYARHVYHPGSSRSDYWAQGRKAALDVVAERIPKDVHDGIVAAFSGAPFKVRA